MTCHRRPGGHLPIVELVQSTAKILTDDRHRRCGVDEMFLSGKGVEDSLSLGSYRRVRCLLHAGFHQS
jgi:hypothetical protein